MKHTDWIVSPAPFILTRPTVSQMSLFTFLTTIPYFIMLIFEKDYAAVINIFVTVAGAILAELITHHLDYKDMLADGSVIIAGIVTGLLLPNTLGVLVCFIVSFSGFLVARAIFGGNGCYWMNPVAVSVCIAFISFPSIFPEVQVSTDSLQTIGNAFGALKLDHFPQIAADQSITQFCNTEFLSHLGIKLPEGYLTLFWNSPSVIPAFRYNVFILIASIILIAMNVIDWVVPLFFLFIYGLCVYLFSLMSVSGHIGGGDILFALLTSGILFIAFYVLPDTSTNPKTFPGKVFSGSVAGFLAFFLCGPGSSSVGCVFIVLISNTVNTVIEYLEDIWAHHLTGAVS